MRKNFKLQLVVENEADESTTTLPGYFEVPQMPAAGDDFTVENVVKGKAVRLYGTVKALVLQPPQAEFEAVAVVKILRTEELGPSAA